MHKSQRPVAKSKSKLNNTKPLRAKPTKTTTKSLTTRSKRSHPQPKSPHSTPVRFLSKPQIPEVHGNSNYPVGSGFSPNPYPNLNTRRPDDPNKTYTTQTESYDDLKQRIASFNANIDSSSYQAIDAESALFPNSATLERLRKAAPSSKAKDLQHAKNLQKGNFNLPSPFEDQMVDSTQRIQQHFQHDQREELYPSDQVEKGKDAKANVGQIGTLEDDEDERTFSRTIFYGFGPNHVVMNGMAFQGSVLATPTMTYLWKPTTWEEVTAESLSFLSFMFPQPDAIIFGCGAVAKAIDPSAHHYLRTLNIPYELMGTYHAMGTFNLMNEEYRKVVSFCITYDHSQSFDKALMQQDKKQNIPEARM